MDRRTKAVVGGVGIAVLLAILATTTMGAAAEFVTPTDLEEDDDYQNELVKLEGQVTDLEEGPPIAFAVDDGNYTKAVTYDGEMPETMSEGRIVVAEGHFDGETLVADDLTVRAHEGEHPDDHPGGVDADAHDESHFEGDSDYDNGDYDKDDY
ncbi:cytochrome c-type biogenesis protein CcmE [Natronomonas pharaonis DSM 2160]|uniref:Cytochrome c-type biogenesis protein CcmE n=1 Tax=Natronomonas pharaonis (strain ATCC 35678 / DSM 2160 / CIP 103997 / JCM 8858 / NBRC 14720 / NCIMB 2260 / Gabara) TaxID=348780 RepID=A0A1U7EVN0_NATPD|nr:cytochrome c maturation protein CcmE [Natronomonas pharaonis]CAI49112.1 cytochrome c-type biogenesis protein CcmE [Natronomonas pharaonis DSM 2160]